MAQPRVCTQYHIHPTQNPTLVSDRPDISAGIGDISELVNNDINRIENIDDKSDTGDEDVKTNEFKSGDKENVESRVVSNVKAK